MAQPFFARLEARARAIDSLLCVGLDPHPQDLPEPGAVAARQFCLDLIEATAPYAAAYKPNSAFFEALGAPGFQVLADVIAAVPDGIPVILDAKRGDIASTNEAYARAAFQVLSADCLTASPYLGQDALAPFLADPAKGVLLLCKTSNPGSSDLQDVDSGGQPLYLRVAQLAQQWNQQGTLGLVVGATYPDVLAAVRAAAPELWILAPGAGAQGGDLPAALAAGLRSDGLGLLVPVSRGISRSADPGQTARDLRDAINQARAKHSQGRLPALPHAQLASDLLRLGCVQFGDFTLKSGQQSPIYLDLRRLVGDPAVLARAAAAYLQLLRGLSFDRITGLPYAGLPIAAAVSLQGGWPLIYPRKEVKDYGTQAAIEGPYEAGETIAVLDDLITTGGSKFEGIDKLTAAGLQVRDVVVLVDRGSGAAERLARQGLRLHAVFDLSQLLEYWRKSGAISAEQHQTVTQFLQQP